MKLDGFWSLKDDQKRSNWNHSAADSSALLLVCAKRSFPQVDLRQDTPLSQVSFTQTTREWIASSERRNQVRYSALLFLLDCVEIIVTPDDRLGLFLIVLQVSLQWDLLKFSPRACWCLSVLIVMYVGCCRNFENPQCEDVGRWHSVRSQEFLLFSSICCWIALHRFCRNKRNKPVPIDLSEMHNIVSFIYYHGVFMLWHTNTVFSFSKHEWKKLLIAILQNMYNSKHKKNKLRPHCWISAVNYLTPISSK